MLKSCKYCGKIHNSNYECNYKPKRKYKAKETENNLFRNTYAWRQKRDAIKKRDMHMCKVCSSGYYNKPIKYNSEYLDAHHIVSLEEDYDLRLEETNIITLCKYHHKLADKGIIPKYALKSLILGKRFDNMLNIVIGSACSGKTTYVKKHMGKGDIVIDIDYIKKALLFEDDEHIKVNDNMINLLMTIKQTILDNPIPNKDIWLITTNPIENTTNYNNVRVIKMKTTKEEALKYLYNDATRLDKEYWQDIIEKWYEKNDTPLA